MVSYFNGKPQRMSGFTLIELLVVLAIMALLLTLAVPRYYGQVEAAKEAVLIENLRQVREVTQRFYGDTGRHPRSLEELVERRYLHRLPVDPLTDSSATWKIESPPEGYGEGVYDLHSGAPGTGANGVPYGDW